MCEETDRQSNSESTAGLVPAVNDLQTSKICFYDNNLQALRHVLLYSEQSANLQNVGGQWKQYLKALHEVVFQLLTRSHLYYL